MRKNGAIRCKYLLIFFLWNVFNTHFRSHLYWYKIPKVCSSILFFLYIFINDSLGYLNFSFNLCVCVLVVSSMPSAHAKQFSRIWRKLLLHARIRTTAQWFTFSLHICDRRRRRPLWAAAPHTHTHTPQLLKHMFKVAKIALLRRARTLKIIFLNFNYYFSLCARDVYSLMLPRDGGGGGGTHNLRISHIEKSHTSAIYSAAGRGEMRLRVFRNPHAPRSCQTQQVIFARYVRCVCV